MIHNHLGIDILGNVVSLITQLSAVLMCTEYVHDIAEVAPEYWENDIRVHRLLIKLTTSTLIIIILSRLLY